MLLEVFPVTLDEKGNIPAPIMAALDDWGTRAIHKLDEHCLKGATDRVRFLVDEWRYSRGPNGGGVFTTGNYKGDSFYTECVFAFPKYADYTVEEKRDAYERLMSIISGGGG